MNSELTGPLGQAQTRLKRYQAALRLASTEIERRNHSIMALTTFAYQAHGVSSPVTLLKLGLVKAIETTRASMGATVLINTDTRELSLGIHQGVMPELAKVLTGYDLEHGATALMPHLVAGLGALLEYRTATDEAERALLKAGRLTSLVSLPLRFGPRLMGAFLLGIKDRQSFTPVELRFVMALSQELSIALEGLQLREGVWQTAETFLGGQLTDQRDILEDSQNLDLGVTLPLTVPEKTTLSPQPDQSDLEQLLAAMMEAEEEVQQQNNDLQTLNTIAEKISQTLNLDEILQCAVEQANLTLNSSAAWIYLVDENQQLRLKAHQGLSSTYARGMQCLSLDEGVEGWVVSNKKAHFLESIVRSPIKHKIWVDREQIDAIGAVPITRPEHQQDTKSNVVGVLAVGRRAAQNYVWSPREGRMLASIANQVALAVDNARLYAQIQEDEVGLRAGNEILRAINDMLLEKNAFWESFVRDDLEPRLLSAVATVDQLLNGEWGQLTTAQRKTVTGLQALLTRLAKQTKQADSLNEALDKEADEVFEAKDKEFIGPTKPIRLEKKGGTKPLVQPDAPTAPAVSSERPAQPSLPAEAPLDLQQRSSSPGPSKEEHKPKRNRPNGVMSFEEAVAGGLVPDFIVQRERESRSS